MNAAYRAGMLHLFDEVYTGMYASVIDFAWRDVTLKMLQELIDAGKTVEELRQEAVENYPRMEALRQ